jgi:SAM-dependent methyltransferase
VVLRKAGYVVSGSDISSRMIDLARANARAAGVRIPFKVSAWHELPRKWCRRFDFVMCHGNAIGHAKGERAMLASFEAMRAVLRDGGTLYVDTRSWEWFRSRSPRYWPGRSVVEGGWRRTIVFRGAVPRRWAEPHVIEIIHIREAGDEVEVEGHPVTFYAFRYSELEKRLRKSGFGNIRTDFSKDREFYSVSAEAI